MRGGTSPAGSSRPGVAGHNYDPYPGVELASCSVHFADKAISSTIKIVNTKLAISENIAFMGCMRKEPSPRPRKCGKVLMKTSLRWDLGLEYGPPVTVTCALCPVASVCPLASTPLTASLFAKPLSSVLQDGILLSFLPLQPAAY